MSARVAFAHGAVVWVMIAGAAAAAGLAAFSAAPTVEKGYMVVTRLSHFPAPEFAWALAVGHKLVT
jgi:hypothetical protein